MKKTVIALALATLCLPVLAQDKKAPEPDYTISGNFGVFSDYRFRGISQTRLAPAAQGGFDFAHKSGFYFGNWNSNVSSTQYLDGAGLEMDVYGGYKTELLGIGLDLGTLYYYYPGANIRASRSATHLGKYDNHEVYFGLSYGPLSFKTNYAVSNYFGLKGTTDDALGAEDKASSTSSKGTIYYDLTFSKEVFNKTTFVAHYGKTSYANYGKLDYSDYKIGVNFDLEGWIIGVAYVGTSDMNPTYKTNFYTNSGDYGVAKNLYKSAGLLSLSKTF